MQEVYCYPLKQHVGAPAQAVVKTGDRVQRGQRIAEIPQGKLGANLHTSVSGVVERVTERQIAVRADAQQPAGFVPVEGGTVLDCIREAGIVGMGGAGFPAHVKLASQLPPDGVVIANCAECEPLLSHNISRLEKQPAQLVHGLRYAMEAAGVERGIIAIKKKHVEAIRSLKNVIDPKRMEIHLLEDLYPMGEERAVVRECLGTLLAPDQLPSAAGAVVCNAETLCRIAEAVEQKKPSITKDITVAGRLNGRPVQVFLDVPTGTSVEAVLERAGGAAGAYGELIMGGPFTGHRTAPDAPVTKTAGGVLVSMPFLHETRPVGLLVCACGAGQERLAQLADGMGAPVVAVERCKQARQMPNGALKCENPGCCPGQAERVLRLKKAGAQVLLISNCTDCTNTVMTIAPKLKMPVYHCTDGALRAAGHPLIRRMKLQKS